MADVVVSCGSSGGGRPLQTPAGARLRAVTGRSARWCGDLTGTAHSLHRSMAEYRPFGNSADADKQRRKDETSRYRNVGNGVCDSSYRDVDRSVFVDRFGERIDAGRDECCGLDEYRHRTVGEHAGIDVDSNGGVREVHEQQRNHHAQAGSGRIGAWWRFRTLGCAFGRYAAVGRAIGWIERIQRRCWQ